MGAVVSTLAFPNPRRDLSADVLRAHPGLVWLTTANGLQIPAVYITPRVARGSHANRPVILYSHGNAEDLGIILPYLQELADTTQCTVCSYEYPGYSLAQGTQATEQLCYGAIQATYNYLTKDCSVSQIVAFGRSLGSGPTVHLCAQESNSKMVGCILQSPLTSAIRCVLDNCTANTLSPFDIFCNEAKVHRIRCPVLIMHGEHDTVVPCAHGRALHSILTQREGHDQIAYDPIWIPHRGHNDMPEDFCLQQCRNFVNWLVSGKIRR